MKLTLKKTFLFFIFTMMSTHVGATGEMMKGKRHLPEIVNGWTRSETPRLIDSKNIFEYMNGAGELYLGYRFKHLEVFDYISKDQANILVELYYMETADDAFGLLSLDWGGESVYLADLPLEKSNKFLAAPTRALYGGGLLRLWSDHIYARIMAQHASAASKAAVLTLGRAIAARTKHPPVPELVKNLPYEIDSSWKLRTDRLTFLRSHLVLNSVYYISHENILNLDHSSQAVIAPFERTSGSDGLKRCQFLLVQYKNLDAARDALNQFHDAYLPDYAKGLTATSTNAGPGLFKLEDGWLAYKLLDNFVAMVFDGPDQESARTIIQENESNLLEKGGIHAK